MQDMVRMMPTSGLLVSTPTGLILPWLHIYSDLFPKLHILRTIAQDALATKNGTSLIWDARHKDLE